MENLRFKFRAWDKNRKKMWSHSDLYKMDCSNEYPFLALIRGFYATNMFPGEEMDVIPMQFTGLYDKHHKPIYEGDIVESLTKINGYVCRGVVIFENGKFMVDVKKAAFARDGFISDFDLKIREYEVIGNIYEHKHLLEGTE